MPSRPPRHRNSALTVEQVEAQRKKDYDRQRQSSSARGYDRKWRMARKDFLQSNPLCCSCQNNGLIVAAEVVDHIKPHKGDGKLFWDRSNWQPLCKSCHSRKTATEDSGFARRTP